MPDVIDEAVERSAELLRSASTPWGFVASPDFGHYAVVWARDALITSLGALRAGDQSLVETTASTLDTLTRHASPLGQVPAVVNPAKSTWDFGEGGAVDATAWLPIIVAEFLAATGDVERTRTWWHAATRAIGWLAHQNVTGSGLLSVAPSTDWMDAGLTRSGRTLHINALYAWAIDATTTTATALGEQFDPPVPDIKGLVDAWFWPDRARNFADLYPSGFAHTAIGAEYRRLAAAERTHYASHIVHAAFVDAVDVLANCLAVTSGVATGARASVVLDAIESASMPWPTRTFTEPVSPGDASGMLIGAVDAVVDPRWSNAPGHYHNGAAWPYVGGFHAAAATVHGGGDAAGPILERLAQANALDGWRFSEWIGPEGPDGAPQQTWNAGTYLYAWSMLGL
jgi:glycogen debranching enzyme